MTPNPALQKLAVVLVIIGFGGLFGWLLGDTVAHEQEFEPRTVQTVLTPVLSGALGLVLALALGVDPVSVREESFLGRLKRIVDVRSLLLLGGLVYLCAGLAGAVIWGLKGDVTPDLVTALTLTVFGYLAATVTALARG